MYQTLPVHLQYRDRKIARSDEPGPWNWLDRRWPAQAMIRQCLAMKKDVGPMRKRGTPGCCSHHLSMQGCARATYYTSIVSTASDESVIFDGDSI